MAIRFRRPRRKLVVRQTSAMLGSGPALVLVPGQPASRNDLTMRLALAIVFGLLAALFTYAYYIRYLQWRDCFNELGRCYDSATASVYLEQAGIAWGSLAFVFALAAFWQFWRFFRARRINRKSP